MTDITVNKADMRSVTQSTFGRVLNVAGIYAVAVLFLAVGAVLQAAGIINNFLTASNMLNIVDAVSMLGIVSVGMAFVTYSGHYADLSVPTTMALTGIVCVEMLKYGFWPAVIFAFIVGSLVGLINAIAVGKFKANPIIWTLAMNYVSMGVIRLVWVNKQIYPDMQASSVRASDLFDSIYRYRFFGTIGLPVVVLIILVVALQFILKRSRFGNQLKMTGAARKAAQFSGINVERIIGVAFMICALTATIGGLTVTSLSRVGAWYNGAGYDFKAVTAVVIGGMTLAGGRGSIIGVLGGVLIIGLMNNIMTLLGVGTFSQDMIRGAIFIIVVGINAKSLRSLGRDDS
ncbi:MAG: ABC transporter permease [Spirochaetaceae bacterium]|nr:ABC transporter permease [Spirochaetaceae bacterium]MDT8297940.1 ABC transporter permease [Spirochaetaceae bacterium]